MIKTRLTRTNSIVMRNVTVFCGLLAFSWKEVTGLHATYFLLHCSLPWISFLWICGRTWNLDELSSVEIAL